MRNLRIPYGKLELIDYEGAGNKTPLLDLNCVKDIAVFDPVMVRMYLENNLKFRKWLKREGLKHQADTVMIYYTSSNNEYQYVLFIGEPNAPVTAKFSEMCGNGIRALALHIYLNNGGKNKKFAIWAGSVKQISIVKVDRQTKSGEVMVDMGRYINHSTSKANLLEKDASVSKLKVNNNLTFTLGSNGISEEGSEPHLVVLYTWNEFKKLSKQLNTSLDAQNIISVLRNIVSTFGKEITFATDIFTHGINFNIGVIKNNRIYMATHERSLSTSKKNCQLEIQQNTFCKCNTLACGTGGAVVANVAMLRGLISSAKQIKTIHPGGEIKYHITPDTTFMFGPARRIE